MSKEFTEVSGNSIITDIRTIKKTLELSPENVKRIYITHEFLVEHSDWKSFLARAGVPYRISSRDWLDAYAAQHHGIVVFLENVSFLTFEHLLRKLEGKETALVVIFDKITDVGNFNAMIRTAYATGVDGVIIPKIGATTDVKKSLIGSAGSTFCIDLCKVTNISRALEDLKKRGYWIVGTEAGGHTQFWDHNFSEKIALVVGSEEKGVRPNILKNCDFIVTIPTVNHIDSLNVSVSFGIILYEILRQRKLDRI